MTDRKNSMFDIKNLINAARGLEPADLVFKNAGIINVFTGEIEQADLAVKNGFIVGSGVYDGVVEVDATGKYLSPGFIDAHIHIESSKVTPAEFARVVAPRGTTAVVADPHEIANVLGLRGIKYLIDITRKLPVDFYFMAPSCVPATHLETAGAALEPDELRELKAYPEVLGLAEMMNFPGVINAVPGVLEKLELFSDKIIDGHAPLVRGKELSAYVLTGVETEHEAVTLEEAREKLSRGMNILIREGSQARNLEALAPLITDFNHTRIAFCTDDGHPEDLLKHGHMDRILRRAVALGLDPVKAVTMATDVPSRIYGLRKKGALAPGRHADIVVLNDLYDFNVDRVYKRGELIASGGKPATGLEKQNIPAWASPMNIGEMSVEDLKLKAASSKIRVIGLVPDQLITENLVMDVPQRNGWVIADEDRDIARLFVIERHKGTGSIGFGLIKGLGLKTGAIASSVAHDSHNIVAAGMSEEEVFLAVKTIEKMGGGQVVVRGEDVLAVQPLPFAGLMSDQPAYLVAEYGRAIRDAAVNIGSRGAAPFMALSFLALPVIPHLKLTDKGLVDVDLFEIVPLFVE